ncbi:MAG: L,D-transpeptidase, partial [Beijerinckiaceae bacterium]
MKPLIPIAAFLAATSMSAIFSPTRAQTWGQSYEQMSGTVGPRPARVTPYAQNVMHAANNLGGGFIEFIVTGRDPTPRGATVYGAEPSLAPRSRSHIQSLYGAVEPQRLEQRPARMIVDPRFRRQEVAYGGPHRPGTIIIDTPNKFLYLVQEGGTAIRYGIGVGRPGFTWAGAKLVTRKSEWPNWTPPPEMLKRRPDLPRFMTGGPDNPLGARALYLGSSL